MLDESAFPIRGETIKVNLACVRKQVLQVRACVANNTLLSALAQQHVHNPNIKKFMMVVHGDSQHTYIQVVLGGTVQPHN